MYYKEFAGINTFLVEMARLLLKDGVVRATRGFSCTELPAPVVIKITNPLARIVTIPGRSWNSTLPYVESLWLASGRNDISMVSHYVKKMVQFSDDNLTMRAGYGPRFRFFTGVSDDYNNGYLSEPTDLSSLNTAEIDQFEFVTKCFEKDPNTRQAIITVGDPAKDCFEHQHTLKKTKDFPCTRDIQFLKNNGKLDVIVHMRSNDFLWGASGVNIFNFTFLQEYFASILNLPIGNYYHIVNNFHFYNDKIEMVKGIAETKVIDEYPHQYEKKFSSLKEFDERLMPFQKYEHALRSGTTKELIEFGDEFFNDWAKVLYKFHFKTEADISYAHPGLNLIINQGNSASNLKNNRDQLSAALIQEQDSTDISYWRQFI